MTEIRIQRSLGRGGFGEVYKGVMKRPGGVEVDVAVKVLRGDLEESRQGIQRFRDEGRLLGRLTHPSILRVYDLVFVDERAALVSEYVPGEDLGRLVRQDAVSPRAALEIVAQVAAALDAAWSQPSVADGKPLHLVHRDIKPDNIRIDPHGAVKLLDFGIARARTVEREANTSTNIIMGSTQYLAPERLVQQETGPEADVFALGCTLFEVLTGEALFARRSMRQMYLLMVNEDRFEQFLAERCGAFRERLVSDRSIALVRAMTRWKKGDRPTAADVAARCDALSDTAPGLTLTQWCRSRAWAPAPEVDGELTGRVIGAPDDAPEAPPPPRPSLPDPPLDGPSGPIPEAAKVSRSLEKAGGPVPWTAAEVVAVYPPTAPPPTASGPNRPPWPRVPQLERQWPEPPKPARPRVTPSMPPEPSLDPVPVAVGFAAPLDPAVEVSTDPTRVRPEVAPLPATPLWAPPKAADHDADLTDPATSRVIAPNPPTAEFDGAEQPTVRMQRSKPPPAPDEDVLDATRPSQLLVDLTLPPPEPVQKQLPALIPAASEPVYEPQEDPEARAARRRARRRSRELASIAIRFGSSLAGLALGTAVLLVLVVVALLVSR